MLQLALLHLAIVSSDLPTSPLKNMAFTGFKSPYSPGFSLGWSLVQPPNVHYHP